VLETANGMPWRTSPGCARPRGRRAKDRHRCQPWLSVLSSSGRRETDLGRSHTRSCAGAFLGGWKPTGGGVVRPMRATARQYPGALIPSQPRGYEDWGRGMAPSSRSSAGRLAQLVEHLPYKQEVACSSQAPPTEFYPGNAMVRRAGQGVAANDVPQLCSPGPAARPDSRSTFQPRGNMASR
jgi:hypothetical protein